MLYYKNLLIDFAINIFPGRSIDELVRVREESARLQMWYNTAKLQLIQENICTYLALEEGSITLKIKDANINFLHQIEEKNIGLGEKILIIEAKDKEVLEKILKGCQDCGALFAKGQLYFYSLDEFYKFYARLRDRKNDEILEPKPDDDQFAASILNQISRLERALDSVRSDSKQTDKGFDNDCKDYLSESCQKQFQFKKTGQPDSTKSLNKDLDKKEVDFLHSRLENITNLENVGSFITSLEDTESGNYYSCYYSCYFAGNLENQKKLKKCMKYFNKQNYFGQDKKFLLFSVNTNESHARYYLILKNLVWNNDRIRFFPDLLRQDLQRFSDKFIELEKKSWRNNGFSLQ